MLEKCIIQCIAIGMGATVIVRAYVIRAFSDFKAFLYILFGGFKPPINLYQKALKSEKARISAYVATSWRNSTRICNRHMLSLFREKNR